MRETIYIQRLAHWLIVLLIINYLLIIGKSIVTPIAFAVFLAFMLKPVCQKIEKVVGNRIISILLGFLVAVLPLAGVITLFTAQSVEVFKNMPSISSRLRVGVARIFETIQDFLPITQSSGQEWLAENFSNALGVPLQLVGGWLTTSGTLIVSTFLVILYTFFFLLYRTSIKNFLLIQFSLQKRAEIQSVFSHIQLVAKDYLYGLSTVIVILGILNSIGLYFIGIKFAVFWGFLGAFLAIVPYIGTFVGGLLPFAYAIATTDNIWQPVAIVILYMGIQTLEGNVITPKVVGDSVEVNPLAAIISLLIGGAMWGISGLILALPFIAILRIIFIHVDVLKPMGLLLSSSLYRDRNKFLEEYDHERYRITNLFTKKRRKF